MNREDHKVISTRDLRQNLAEVLSYTASRKEPVILTRNGSEQAAIVSLPEFLLLNYLKQKVSFREIVQEFERDGYNYANAWKKLKEQFDGWQQEGEEPNDIQSPGESTDGSAQYRDQLLPD